MSWICEPERSGDESAIRSVLTAAFPTRAEADLVERLGQAGLTPWVSWVARSGDGIVGHVLFTEVGIEDGSDGHRAMALAPLAVAPSHQRSGVGTALTRAALPTVHALGHRFLFVLAAR